MTLKQEGLQPYYAEEFGKATGVINPRATGYRLLTEAEWSWLAFETMPPADDVAAVVGVTEVDAGLPAAVQNRLLVFLAELLERPVRLSRDLS